jgi:hypothetical protein
MSGSGNLPLLPSGEKVADRLDEGVRESPSAWAFSHARIASHTSGTSARRGEEGARETADILICDGPVPAGETAQLTECGIAGEASAPFSLLPLGRRWSEGPDEGFPSTPTMPLGTPHLPFGHLLPKGRRGSQPDCQRSISTGPASEG